MSFTHHAFKKCDLMINHHLQVMVWESKVLRHLSNLSTVPSHIHQSKHHYSHDTVDYMVMELLSGEDMSILRDRTRSAVGFIPIPVVSYLSTQMLRCIRDMHETGYIHRSVVPLSKNSQIIS